MPYAFRKTEENSKEYKILKTIERQGNNCKRIVENLISFTRMPEGVQYDTDVNRNIELVLEVVQNTLLTRKIDYEETLAAKITSRGTRRCRAVATSVHESGDQCRKGYAPGGKISINSRLNQAGDKVEVLITDTGIGIKKEHLSLKFLILFTTRKVGEGTGLGLSVSYAIISKFGGTIYCASKSEDEFGEGESGTTFTVSLPVIMSGSGNEQSETV